VAIGGFGSFQATLTPARKARNPKTGDPVEVKAKKRIKFAAYTKFKNTVQGINDGSGEDAKDD
jgi:DNA-binding protein HU-beta